MSRPVGYLGCYFINYDELCIVNREPSIVPQFEAVPSIAVAASNYKKDRL